MALGQPTAQDMRGRLTDLGGGNWGKYTGGFLQFASGYYEPSTLTKQIIHPRPSTETNAYAISRRAYPGIKWRIPVCVNGLAKPVLYTVSGPTGMAFSKSFADYNSETGEYTEDGEVGMLEWDNPTTGTHEYTITAQGQNGAGDTVSVTSSLEVTTTGFIFVSTTGDDANAGTLAAPLRNIEKAWDGTFGEVQVIVRAGTYTPASDCFISGATHPKVLMGYPGESVTYNGTNSVFRANSGADISISNIAFDTSNQALAQSRFIYITNNHSDNRASFFDLTFNNFNVGTDGTDNPGPFTLLDPGGGPRKFFAWKNITLTNITDSANTGALGSFYNVGHSHVSHVTFGSGVVATRGVFLKSVNPEFAIHHVTALTGDFLNGAVSVGLGINLGFEENLNIEVAYCKLKNTDTVSYYAIRHQNSATTPVDNPTVYIFRNNVQGAIGNGGSNTTPSIVTIKKNLIQSDQATVIQQSNGSVTVVDTGNVVGATTAGYFDANMDAQTNGAYTLGQRGANMYSGV